MRKTISCIFLLILFSSSLLGQTTLEKLARKIYSGASDYYEKEQYDKSLKYLDMMINQIENPRVVFNDTLLLIDIYDLSADCYFQKSEYQTALKRHQKIIALELTLYGNDNKDVANTYVMLGSLNQSIGDDAQALECFVSAYSVINNNFSVELEARILDVIAGLYSKKHDYEQAKEFYTRLVNFLVDKDYRFNTLILSTYRDLGYACHMLGDYSNSIINYQKYLDSTIAIFGDSIIETKLARVLLGMVYTELGNYNDAIKYHKQALTGLISYYGENHALVAETYNSLGNAYFRLGDILKAKASFSAALDIRKKLGDHRTANIAESYMNLGTLISIYGNLQEAQSFFDKASTIYDYVYDSSQYESAEIFQTLGTGYLQLKNFEKGKYYLEKSRYLYKQFANIDNPKIAEIDFNIGVALYMEGDTLGTLKHILQSHKLLSHYMENTVYNLPLSFKESFCNSHHFRLDFFYYLLNFTNTSIENSKYVCEAYNSTLLLKGLIFRSELSLQKTIIQSNDLQIKDQYHSLKICKQYQNALIFSKNSSPNFQKKWDSLVFCINNLEQKLVNYPDLVQKYVKINASSIILNLDSNEAVVEYVNYKIPGTVRTKYSAFILTKESEIPIFLNLFEESELNSFLSKFTGEPLEVKISEMYLSSRKGKELYSLCWAPIDSLLGGIKTVHVSTSGLLHNISLSILPIGEDSILSDKYEFHYVSSTADIANKSLESPTIKNLKSLTMYSGITYDSCYITDTDTFSIPRFTGIQCNEKKWGPLPDFTITASLIDSIEPFLDSLTPLKTIYATKKSFFELDGQSPDILHFFTHGFYCPLREKTTVSSNDILYSSPDFNVYKHHENPLFRTGLVMAGGNKGWLNGSAAGILTAYEVLSMDLSNTDLVILSACVTGLGDIEPYEGVYGLQRAFKVAGANNIIMSLWPVTVTYTKLFFGYFYHNLIKNQTVREAFYNSQNTLRQNHANSPDYWGGFVLLE